MELTTKEQEARKMVCLPLDGIHHLRKRDLRKRNDPMGELSVESRVEELSPVVGLFKIGYELFTLFGPDAIKLVHDYGAEVFLDLKYNDIPNTVKGAARAATRHGVHMFNVHASGGFEMMQAAMDGVREGVELYDKKSPLVTVVTVLTSFDEAAYLETFKQVDPALQEIPWSKYRTMGDDEELMDEFSQILSNRNLHGIIQDQVLNLATLAQQAGLDGIVCSAVDLSHVGHELPKDFMKVTPGIKGPNTPAGADQKRVFTPGNAVQDGSSTLVIGRAITGASDRIQAGYEVLQDMAKYL